MRGRMHMHAWHRLLMGLITCRVGPPGCASLRILSIARRFATRPRRPPFSRTPLRWAGELPQSPPRWRVPDLPICREVRSRLLLRTRPPFIPVMAPFCTASPASLLSLAHDDKRSGAALYVPTAPATWPPCPNHLMHEPHAHACCLGCWVLPASCWLPRSRCAMESDNVPCAKAATSCRSRKGTGPPEGRSANARAARAARSAGGVRRCGQPHEERPKRTSLQPLHCFDLDL